MSGLLYRLICTENKAKNNEQYREALKKRRARMFAISAVGILTFLGLVIAQLIDPSIADNSMVFYWFMGVGIGLAFSGLLIALRMGKTLKDETQLKAERLKETDEREVEIGRKALEMTAKIMLAVFYVADVIGVFFEPVLVGFCTFLILGSVLLYQVLKRYLSRVL